MQNRIEMSDDNSSHHSAREAAETEIPVVNYTAGLPNGKISKNGIRNPVKKQKGMTCTLYAMRRIAFFNTADDKSVQAYKAIKQGLASFNLSSENCFENLIDIANRLLKNFNINLEQAIHENLSYMSTYDILRCQRRTTLSPMEMYHKSHAFTQWITLYSILIQKILVPLFNLQQAEWHPDKGINGLQNSLNNKGGHFFIGKYGTWCYNQKPEEFSAECTSTRQVFSFRKNSYQADSAKFTHGIIVDQIKKVSGKEMVFYRDPNFPSIPGMREKVFMLSYENFVNRLTDTRGLRFNLNECSKKESFGLTSRVPEKIYSL